MGLLLFWAGCIVGAVVIIPLAAIVTRRRSNRIQGWNGPADTDTLDHYSQDGRQPREY